MPAQTFLFYDLETSGLNKCFDQVLQFAGIWTDANLQEIKREEIIVKLNPDVIPHPYASITHRIPLDRLATGIPEYLAIQKIHQWFNQPNCISLGYNTLGFDDEFLRFSFYRNLFNPYSHQYANGCQRMDIYPIAVLYYLFKPEGINWPQRDGKPSLKLDALMQANNLAQGPAHDAMVDVEATLAFARVLARDQPMWQYCLNHFDKAQDAQQQAKLNHPAIQPTSGKQPSASAHTEHSSDPSQHGLQHGIMVNAKFGAKSAYQGYVLNLGVHQIYRNQNVWLRLDNSDFASQSTQTSTQVEGNWIENLAVINRRPAEQSWLLPANPRYLRNMQQLQQDQYQKNLDFLTSKPQLLQQIQKHYTKKTWPEVENIDLQANLYSRGFRSPNEMQALQAFHACADPQHKYALSQQFADANDRSLAWRIIGRNFLDSFEKAEQLQFIEYCRNCWQQPQRIDYRGQAALSQHAAKACIQNIRQQDQKLQLDEQQLKQLTELEYLLEQHATSTS